MTRLRRAAGYTLIEMCASMIVLGVILLACGSIVGLATRATNDAGLRTSTQMQSADAAAQIADDLNVALNFTQRTPTAVAFTVPDRLGLGSPQQVTYAWAGTAASPLTRQFNGGAPTTLLPGVRNFNLNYAARLMGTTTPATQTVCSCATSIGPKDAPIDNKNYAAEFFTPLLPLGTASYSLTKLRVQMKAAGQAGLMTVQVTAPTLPTNPTTNVLAATTVYESGFSNNYEYIDIPFTGLTGLNPAQTLCFVFSYNSGPGQIGVIETSTALTSLVNSCSWTTSSNAGSTWATPTTLTAPLFYVFGTTP